MEKKNNNKIDLDLDEVKIYDDNLSELDILRKLVDEKSEDPIHMLDIGDIVRKHRLWLEKMPRVAPYYAVKCNPDPTVIKVIAALGGCFDCASMQEIDQVMSHGVSADRIIYANPIKYRSHIMYAKKVGVALTTADSKDELRKIKDIYPETKIVIRIRCDASVTPLPMGEKYGCDPVVEAVRLIETCLDLGLTLRGFSFHVGSPCFEPTAFRRGIRWCKSLIDTARSMGCSDARLIDIGGGISGERDLQIDEFSEAINDALEDVDSSVEVISEPGRYYVASAFTSAACIFSKKTLIVDEHKSFMYYVSDGKYCSFMTKLFSKMKNVVSLRNFTSANQKEYPSTVWGPTCSPMDVILKNHMLPEYNIGDWLVWLDTGAYTTCYVTKFNGFPAPKTFLIVRRKDWNYLLTEIKKGDRQRTKEDIKVIKLDVSQSGEKIRY